MVVPTGPTSKGDVVGAIGCGTAVATILLLVLSGGTPVAQTPASSGDGTPPMPMPTSSVAPGP
ncbi:hypothetical protein [Streptomyces mirabilis]|uniref:hypothetical protein n=1 Tax=Streptomyces mirabilis TaxID=68239 RepID=UPI003407E334